MSYKRGRSIEINPGRSHLEFGSKERAQPRSSEAVDYRVESAKPLDIKHYHDAVRLAGEACKAARARGYVDGSKGAKLISDIGVEPPIEPPTERRGLPGRPSSPSYIPIELEP